MGRDGERNGMGRDDSGHAFTGARSVLAGGLIRSILRPYAL
jgi:hypothetical protein